jgi:hypothetical protein
MMRSSARLPGAEPGQHVRAPTPQPRCGGCKARNGTLPARHTADQKRASDTPQAPSQRAEGIRCGLHPAVTAAAAPPAHQAAAVPYPTVTLPLRRTRRQLCPEVDGALARGQVLRAQLRERRQRAHQRRPAARAPLVGPRATARAGRASPQTRQHAALAGAAGNTARARGRLRLPYPPTPILAPAGTLKP